MSDDQNVFIPVLEIQKAAKSSFERERKISFVLTKRDARKINKQLEIIKEFMNTRRGSLGMFGALLLGLRFLLMKMYAIFFNSRLNDVHEFFGDNYKKIEHYENSVFNRNNKMMIITFYADNGC